MGYVWSMEVGGRVLPLGYLAGTAAMLWLMNQAKRSFWLFSLLALPGTLCHEGCHWLAGKLLNGRPVHFTVLPRREGHGLVLGTVTFGNLHWYNAFFIGLAPLGLLPLAYGLFLWRLGGNPEFGWPEAGMLYLLANLLFGSMPSWQDLRIAARSPIGWLLLAGALVWGWMRFTKGGITGKAPAVRRAGQGTTCSCESPTIIPASAPASGRRSRTVPC
jgi:hypothetical protein